MNNLAVIDNKALSHSTNYSLAIWDQEEFLTSVKEVFSKDLSPIEFKLFLEMGKALNLNPFLKEIWAVKFGSSAAQIFIGRDGYRKAAQRDPDYEYHYCEAVYANDVFEAKEGIYDHQFNLKDRGALRGAFCKVKKKSSERPFCLYVPFEEYNKNQSNWKTMPSTMIKKVAEAQCLRMAFQDTFSGTYSEAEDWIEATSTKDETKDHKKLSSAIPLQMPPIQKESMKPTPSPFQSKNLEVEKTFNASLEFTKRASEFIAEIEDLCNKELGKYDIDAQFENSFKSEFLAYFKEEFIKNGVAPLSELFKIKLTAKRLNILALGYNAAQDVPLSDKELTLLKTTVYNIYIKDVTQNLQDVFAREAEKHTVF